MAWIRTRKEFINLASVKSFLIAPDQYGSDQDFYIIAKLSDDMTDESARVKINDLPMAYEAAKDRVNNLLKSAGEKVFYEQHS